MGAVYFYHLTQRPLEATLPLLLEKAQAQGWRIEVRGRDADRMAWLDEKLWLGAEEGFLAHGIAGGPHDAAQPILLSTSALPDIACLMCIDGVAPTAQEVEALERACILFDGADARAVDQARGHWKSLTDAGCAAQYWSEADGRWQKKAESVNS